VVSVANMPPPGGEAALAGQPAAGQPAAGQPAAGQLTECVVNVSEGRDRALLAAIAGACGRCLLDLHSDQEHNRSVFTLAGDVADVEVAVKALARLVVSELDLAKHVGAHPRLGVLDVVPWVSLEGPPVRDAAGLAAVEARDRFARWAAGELALPVFLYGPHRSLPEVRRSAWRVLQPDLGPSTPHPSAGSVAVGARPLMVAYNLWLGDADLGVVREMVRQIRSPTVRALAFALSGPAVQASFNLIAPFEVGPADIWDKVSTWVPVERAELVGLLPREVLCRTPPSRWAELGISAAQTIEARLAACAGGAQGQPGG